MGIPWLSDNATENCSDDPMNDGMDKELKQRFQRTMYGGVPVSDSLPLAFTDIAVEFFQDSVPRGLRGLSRVYPSCIARQNRVSPCSVILSMIYTKRLQQKNPEYLLQISSSDLFFISMMVASKYLYNEGDEEEVLVDEWADSVEKDLDEVIELERSFLAAMDWQLFVRDHEFEQAMQDMEKRLAYRNGHQHGWFTYSDLQALATDPMHILWSNVGKEWVQVVAVSSLAYLAGVISMVGSTVLVFQSSAALSLASSALASANQHFPGHAIFDFCQQSGSLLPVAPGIQEQNLPGNPNISEPTLDEKDEEDEQGNKPNVSVTPTPLFPPSAPETMTGASRSLGRNNIFRKFWALLTLKNTLVQFVCAVSDGYSTWSRERFHHQHTQRVGQADEVGEHRLSDLNLNGDDEAGGHAGLASRLSGLDEGAKQIGSNRCQCHCFCRFHESAREKRSSAIHMHDGNLETSVLSSGRQRWLKPGEFHFHGCCCHHGDRPPEAALDSSDHQFLDLTKGFTTSSFQPVWLGA